MISSPHRSSHISKLYVVVDEIYAWYSRRIVSLCDKDKCCGFPCLRRDIALAFTLASPGDLHLNESAAPVSSPVISEILQTFPKCSKCFLVTDVDVLLYSCSLVDQFHEKDPSTSAHLRSLVGWRGTRCLSTAAADHQHEHLDFNHSALMSGEKYVPET